MASETYDLNQELNREYWDCIEYENNQYYDNMSLADYLHMILFVDIVRNNLTHNVNYFKQRLENESITEDLVGEAMEILEILLNSDNLEKIVESERPEQQNLRRENLNMLVKICEKIVGV